MRIIKSIEIRHFRSIHSETIRELANFNVFGGTNDSGKSNILRALNLFFNQETSFLEQFKFSDDYSKLALLEAREKKKGRQFISIKVVLDESAIRGKAELKKLAKQNGGLWIIREWWNFEGTYREKLPEFIEKASQGVKRSLSLLLASMRFVYIPAFKNNEVFSYVISMVANEENLFINQKGKEELNAQIAASATDLAQDFATLTKINTKVSLPITLDSFWSSLQVATDFEKSKEKEIKRGSIEDYLIGLVARGEGIKSIFTPIILGWLARKNKKRYWVWGIDEPENSLESSRTVSLYRKFVDYSKDAQIFSSSHSPVFIFPDKEYAASSTATFITTQEAEGDTRFKRIDVTSTALKDRLMKEFGADYGSFLGMQEDYAKKLQTAEMERDDIRAKINQLTRSVVFVEGELDEKYFAKAIQICRNGTYPADVRWIGALNEQGKSYFTGDSALKKCEEFLLANPGFLRNKVVLLYDVDVAKQRYNEGRLLVLSPTKQTDRRYETGIEHLLSFPTGFDHERFVRKETKRKGDKTTVIQTPDKTSLCAEICDSLPIEQQRQIFAEIDGLLTDIEQFLI